MFVPGYSALSAAGIRAQGRAETGAAFAVLVIACAAVLFAPQSEKGKKILKTATWIAAPFLAAACAASLAGGAYNPFIYFQF